MRRSAYSPCFGSQSNSIALGVLESPLPSDMDYQVCSLFPSQVTGKCGSVLVRLIPAPRGTSIVAAAVPKKLLHMAGVSDCYTSARGQTATLGNFGESGAFVIV